jgi:mercuric ion binding protein
MRTAGLLLTSLALVAVAPLLVEAAAPPALAAQSLQTVTLDLQNMSCAACPIAVRTALKRVPGVVEANVDFGSKTAVVTFDPAKTNVETLTRATADVGFPSRLKP